MASSIEWLNGGETWNPIKARRKSDGKKGWACVRISPGCEHCYSEAQNVQCGSNPTRHGTGLKYTVPSLDQVELYLDEEVLMQPLHWRKGKLVFPCSMTDWMADFVPDEWRDKMLAVMALTQQHTYLSLTKRADRQQKYMTALRREGPTHGYVALMYGRPARAFPSEFKHLPFNNESRMPWPLPNLWLGVSAEDQQRADERIPQLLQTPAAIRWASLEPLLGPITLTKYLNAVEFTGHLSEQPKDGDIDLRDNADFHHLANAAFRHIGGELLDWGVIGLESGGKARPGNIEWIRHLVMQFRAAGVPVFVKQLGAKPYIHKEQSVHIDKPGLKFSMQSLEINSTFKLNDPKGGDMSEWPEDLRVREYPKIEAVHA